MAAALHGFCSNCSFVRTGCFFCGTKGQRTELKTFLDAKKKCFCFIPGWLWHEFRETQQQIATCIAARNAASCTNRKPAALLPSRSSGSKKSDLSAFSVRDTMSIMWWHKCQTFSKDSFLTGYMKIHWANVSPAFSVLTGFPAHEKQPQPWFCFFSSDYFNCFIYFGSNSFSSALLSLHRYVNRKFSSDSISHCSHWFAELVFCPGCLDYIPSCTGEAVWG